MVLIVHDNGKSLHGEEAPGDPATTGVPAFHLGDRWWRWVSVADVNVDDGARLNAEVKRATLVYADGEWCDRTVKNRVPTRREHKELNGAYDADEHRAYAALHAVVGTVDLADAAARSGFTAAELVAEAEAWGL